MNELNKKLGEFADWYDITFFQGILWGTPPDSDVDEWLPDFLNDITACLKWFKAPLVRKLGYEGYCKFIREWADEFTLHNEEPALAFSKAVELLMEKK